MPLVIKYLSNNAKLIEDNFGKGTILYYFVADIPMLSEE